VISLWRYPVKSMLGEELRATDLTDQGIAGDHIHAIWDPIDGKIASAKNPRKWAKLLDFRAALVGPMQASDEVPPIRITLPDGTMVTSDEDDFDQVLSDAITRKVTLRTTTPETPSLRYEYDRPDIDGLDRKGTVTEHLTPEGAFFDAATVHLLTTATISRLGQLYPNGCFEYQRFRPNIVVETALDETRFAENEWIGRTLTIGDEVRLSITGPCPRCVMVNLPQGNLPKDPGILRAVARYNGGNAGVYAAVRKSGTIRRGDSVRLS
jgi:uncharacterized protein YcbX